MATSIPHTSNAPKGKLRIIETTDLHMQLLDYDYFADRPDPRIGLIGLADKITDLRNEQGITTILCDNGDLIQGNPLADHLADHLAKDETHPMIAALNLLDYDAMTLGNHEFDYGLDFLQAATSKASFPIVSANVSAGPKTQIAKPFVVLKREITCDDGLNRPLKIGITGFAPPQIVDFQDQTGVDSVLVEDIVDAARKIVPRMRAAGADLIVALCHSGLGASQHLPGMENAAIPLAKIDGVDILLMGHTHDGFPGDTTINRPEIDHWAGRIHGKPAVMATFCGKSLGVIDLGLTWEHDAWTIADHRSYLEEARTPKNAESKLQQELRSLVGGPHAATLEKMRAPIAQTSIPIASYFATIQPDLAQQLLARAMKQTLSKALSKTDYNAIPMLAAKSSFRFGGRSGLGHYIDIHSGPITLRDAAAIFPFSDKLCAVRRTGKQLRLWLERSAAHYNQLGPDEIDQPLINPQSAGYNCDTVFGLSYEIDLAQPARFDTHGVETNPNCWRICHMHYQGQLVADDDIFIVATNSFRAKGGGGFPEIAPEDIVFTSPHSVRVHLIEYLKAIGTVTEPVHPTWSFAPIAGATATFASAPQAKHHLNAPIEHIGPRPDGFDTYRIHF